MDPQSARIEFRETPGELQIQFTAHRNGFVLAFLSIWITGWLWGGLQNFGSAAFWERETFKGGFWMLGWVAGLGFAAFNLAWSLFGREQLTLRHDRIFLRMLIGPFILTRECETSATRNWRLSPSGAREGIETRGYFWVNAGRIGFDCGERTYRFGEGINRTEALRCVELITHFLEDQRT